MEGQCRVGRCEKWLMDGRPSPGSLLAAGRQTSMVNARDRCKCALILTWYTTSKFSFTAASETPPKYSSKMSTKVRMKAKPNSGSTAPSSALSLLIRRQRFALAVPTNRTEYPQIATRDMTASTWYIRIARMLDLKHWIDIGRPSGGSQRVVHGVDLEYGVCRGR